MNAWIGTTASGTKYVCNDGQVTVLPVKGDAVRFKMCGPLMVLDTTFIMDAPFPWEDGASNYWSQSTAPTVGQHAYLSSKDAWRISTAFVHVREIS